MHLSVGSGFTNCVISFVGSVGAYVFRMCTFCKLRRFCRDGKRFEGLVSFVCFVIFDRNFVGVVHIRGLACFVSLVNFVGFVGFVCFVGVVSVAVWLFEQVLYVL